MRTRATKPGACMSCRTVPKARKAKKPRSPWPAAQINCSCLPNYFCDALSLFDAYAHVLLLSLITIFNIPTCIPTILFLLLYNYSATTFLLLILFLLVLLYYYTFSFAPSDFPPAGLEGEDTQAERPDLHSTPIIIGSRGFPKIRGYIGVI